MKYSWRFGAKAGGVDYYRRETEGGVWFVAKVHRRRDGDWHVYSQVDTQEHTKAWVLISKNIATIDEARAVAEAVIALEQA